MRVSIQDLKAFKQRGERFSMLTAYDYATARTLDAAGIPVLLVGDSLGMVSLGYDTTLPVTLDDIIHHCRAVVRGTERALIVADLPFLTYQVSPEEALRNAGRLIQEGGAQTVKLEGGRELAPTVARIVRAGIPVMGHLGLTPQSVNQLGGFRVQAKTTETIRELVRDARALEDAGIFALVLECIPAAAAKIVTESVSIPTIGIGAGPDCDAQVQIITDLLHLIPGRIPKHARAYLEVGELIRQAVEQYDADVRAGSFPTEKESFAMPKGVDLDALTAALDEE
ncbi:MAG TPA: 3-methyl-2-oxobutanoate hydroxymethyltransferase [Nitrolancea sp.]|jgi:3-methyl-2-oxobutanoate hydroxymethyltransferase|nr:3-methyl-2-oxobutanoate hydroxymethyltransferase [Nitrolancea sp.]